MPTTEWITDRLPPAEDADNDGDVEIPCRPNDDLAYQWQHWSLIVPCQPWRRSNGAALGLAAAW